MILFCEAGKEKIRLSSLKPQDQISTDLHVSCQTLAALFPLHLSFLPSFKSQPETVSSARLWRLWQVRHLLRRAERRASGRQHHGVDVIS